MRPGAKTFHASRLLLRVAAPQHEDRWLSACCNGGDTGIGDRIPAAPGMAARLPCLDRQRVVETFKGCFSSNSYSKE